MGIIQHKRTHGVLIISTVEVVKEVKRDCKNEQSVMTHTIRILTKSFASKGTRSENNFL